MQAADKKNITKMLEVLVEAVNGASEISSSNIEVTPEYEELILFKALKVGDSLSDHLPKATGWVNITFKVRYKR